MFFDQRRKYNGRVAALLPAFGFTLDDAGIVKTADALTIAWEQEYSEYEGAIYIAYLVFSGMLKAKDARAPEVMRRIEYVQKDWIAKGLVHESLASRFSSMAKEWTRVENQRVATKFSFSPNMPDIMQREPLRAFAAGQFLMLLIEDVPSIGERMSGSVLPLRFPYVLAVISSVNHQPALLVTLEVGFTSDSFLCVFDSTGAHRNLGSGSSYMEQLSFQNAAIAIACKSLGLDLGTVVEVVS